MSTYKGYSGTPLSFPGFTWAGIHINLDSPVGFAPAPKAPSFLTGGLGDGPPVWPSFTFGEGVVGIAYSQDFDLYPALSPTTFTVVSGSLPPGLSLSNVSADIGRLSGTPTTPGSYSFTLRATNSLGTADKAFTLLVVLPGSGGAFPFWG